jgi:hypothetical protein
MSEPEVEKTKPIKTNKTKAPPLEYKPWELIVFIGVSALLIIANAIFWVGLVSSVSQTVGGSWARIILNVGLGATGLLLLLYAGLLFIYSRRSLRGIWVIWGILLASLIIGVSIMLGVRSGLNIRMQTDQQQRLTAAAEHFNYGVQALTQGDLAAAKTQFLYVNELVPNFPGLVEKLTEVELQMALALTPIATPTPEPVAIPTGGSTDEYFNLAQQAIQNQDWASALKLLETIRNIDLNYKQTQMDDLYYLVLRNLGVAQIKANDLETGIFNLTLAAKFAPLDVDAARYLSYAKADIQTNVWLGYAAGLNKIANDLANSNQSACDILKAYQVTRTFLDQHGISGTITFQGDSADLDSTIKTWFPICHPPTRTPTITPTPTVTEPAPVVTTEPPPVESTTEVPTDTPTP